MGWLISLTIASMVGAFVAVRIVEYVVTGLVGSLASSVKASLLVSAWTAITTGLGDAKLTKGVRKLRQSNKGAIKKRP